ncbi:hypothetical protein Trydic_g21421 [Trypoxylus dichotomus]
MKRPFPPDLISTQTFSLRTGKRGRSEQYAAVISFTVYPSDSTVVAVCEEGNFGALVNPKFANGFAIYTEENRGMKDRLSFEAAVSHSTTLFQNPHWSFQRSSVPDPTAKSIQEWLEENVPEIISVNHWPSSSSDLNPLDYELHCFRGEWPALKGRIKISKRDKREPIRNANSKLSKNVSENSAVNNYSGEQLGDAVRNVSFSPGKAVATATRLMNSTNMGGFKLDPILQPLRLVTSSNGSFHCINKANYFIEQPQHSSNSCSYFSVAMLVTQLVASTDKIGTCAEICLRVNKCNK